ncbi:MAG: hypothetical protein HY231_23305, partial [Acidobacteria bacterium]|nr:hypothetical protein [Acidobacteriota bacterium]
MNLKRAVMMAVLAVAALAVPMASWKTRAASGGSASATTPTAKAVPAVAASASQPKVVA